MTTTMSARAPHRLPRRDDPAPSAGGGDRGPRSATIVAVPRLLRRLVAPLTDGLTYRRYVHLLFGAVILLPYVGLVALIVATVDEGGLDLIGLVLIVGPATGIAVGVTLVPGVRVLSITAARALLGADVPEPDPATIDGRCQWPSVSRWGQTPWSSSSPTR